MMGTGRWGGRGSELGGMRDAPSPMIAEDGEPPRPAAPMGRRGGRASEYAGARDAPDKTEEIKRLRAEAKRLGTINPQKAGELAVRADDLERDQKQGKDGDDLTSGIITDPPVSEAQRKAMFAAKSGNSTLGIPQSVGKEFAEADPGGKLPAKAKDGFLVNGLPNGPRESQQELAEAKKQGLSPRFNKTTGKVEYEDRRGRSGLGQQPKAKDAEDPDERLHFQSAGAMTPQAKRRRIEQLKEMVARGEISESVLRAKVRKFGLEDI